MTEPKVSLHGSIAVAPGIIDGEVPLVMMTRLEIKDGAVIAIHLFKDVQYCVVKAGSTGHFVAGRLSQDSDNPQWPWPEHVELTAEQQAFVAELTRPK